MHQPRPVPGIARGPQQFSQTVGSPVPHPMAMQSQSPPPQTVSDEEAFQDLAMEIYTRLVSKHICADSFPKANADPELFRELAKASQAAAMAYFKALGVQFPEGTQQ